jgi:hypothetical protein
VAKASRKTDVYAFAMLSWELLTESELFPDIISETVLCSRVHQGLSHIQHFHLKLHCRSNNCLLKFFYRCATSIGTTSGGESEGAQTDVGIRLGWRPEEEKECDRMSRYLANDILEDDE